MKKILGNLVHKGCAGLIWQIIYKPVNFLCIEVMSTLAHTCP
jgi:hypothetical protein